MKKINIYFSLTLDNKRVRVVIIPNIYNQWNGHPYEVAGI